MNNPRQTILIGAVAYDPKVIAIWDMIREYFHDHDFPVDYVLFSNYEAQVDALLRGFVDIAWNTNVAYVRIQEMLNGQAKVLAMRDTDIGFTTKIIARTDRGIHTLDDLKNRKYTFALGSADSGQAAILPYHFLKMNGIRPNEDVDIIRFNLDVGKHGDTGTSEYEVLRALQNGVADAGAIGESTWIRMLEQGLVNTEQIRGIWTSPGYSHCNFTVLPAFDDELGRRFSELLFAMDPADPKIRHMMEMEGLNQWVSAEGDGLRGYDILFEAMREQELVAGV